MGTIVIFSKDEDTLAEIKSRAVKLEFDPQWIPVEEWVCRLDSMLHAVAVILDEVDGEFVRREEVVDLEQYLLETPRIPPRMFLVPGGCRRLDSFARSDPSNKVHHQPDKFTDEEIYSLVHSRRFGLQLPV